jgi:hypothetical protein
MGKETLRCFWVATRRVLAAGGVFGRRPSVRSFARRSSAAPVAWVAIAAISLCVGCGAQDRAKSPPEERTAMAKTDAVTPAAERVKTLKTIAAKTPPIRVRPNPYPSDPPPKAVHAPAVRDPEAADPEAADPEVVEPVTAEPGETPPDETDPSGAEADDDYTVMNVFYGTDRDAVEVTAPKRSVAWTWLWSALTTAGVSALLVLRVARAGRRLGDCHPRPGGADGLRCLAGMAPRRTAQPARVGLRRRAG